MPEPAILTLRRRVTFGTTPRGQPLWRWRHVPPCGCDRRDEDGGGMCRTCRNAVPRPGEMASLRRQRVR